AQPSTDVKDARARCEFRQRRETNGGRLAAAVKLIERRKIIDREGVKILSRLDEDCHDLITESFTVPVGSDRLEIHRVRHFAPPHASTSAGHAPVMQQHGKV
ncbi:MAG: hypothetical protein AB7P40_20495, partial [Chloroflexota bacterium]